jgi:hypothetical protein
LADELLASTTGKSFLDLVVEECYYAVSIQYASHVRKVLDRMVLFAGYTMLVLLARRVMAPSTSPKIFP